MVLVIDAVFVWFSTLRKNAFDYLLAFWEAVYLIHAASLRRSQLFILSFEIQLIRFDCDRSSPFPRSTILFYVQYLNVLHDDWELVN